MRPVTRRRRPTIEPLEPRAYLTSATITLAQPVSFTAGTRPVALAAADFNNDGHQDLAVADATTEKVDIFFGTGTGTFTTGPQLVLSAPPTALVVGDFNGDGRPDIAVACSAGAADAGTSVTVFLNTGNGTFGLGEETQVETTLGSGDQVALATGDFNADGHLDLVATDPTDGDVSVLLGTGTGTFAEPVAYNVGDDPTAVAVGDFNEDGKLDVAVACTLSLTSGLTTGASADGVVTLLGGGDGTFTTGSVTPLTASASSTLVAGDLTGDGKAIDLAVGNDNGTVTVLVDNGADTFTAATNPAVGGAPTGLAIADLNLDGHDDIVAADGGAGGGTGTDAVTIIPGAGTGTVGTAVTASTSAVPDGVVVADFNGDGKPDVATANTAAGTVDVLLNDTVLPAVTTKTTLSATPTSTPAGSPVTLTATVAPASVSPLAGESTPTGTVDFYDGTALLGTADLTATAAGTGVTADTATASLTVTALAVGTHKLYAKYAADTAYAASGSAATAETVTATATSGPNLVPTFSSITLPATIAPGESGTAKVKITNEGNATGTGPITNGLDLSLDATLDAGDTPLTVKGALAKSTVKLAPGASVTLTGTFTVPSSVPLASYLLLVDVDTNGAISQSDTADDVTASPTAYSVVDQFGTVGGKKGVPLTVTNAAGGTATFKLAGPGTGTVNIGDDGVDVLLAGTTAASAVTVTPGASSTFALTTLSAASAMGSIKAPAVAVTSAVDLDGAKSVSLGDVSGATLSLGAVQSLAVADLASGTLAAAALGTFTDTGRFGGSASAASVKSVVIDGTDTGSIDTTGNIGPVLVRGSLTGGSIVVGIGAAASKLTSLRVLGSATAATVVVGASQADDTLAAGGTLGSLTVVGAVDATSRFLAATEPKKASLGGVAVDPATDPRFSA